MANARVISVNVGREAGATWAGGLKRTAIDKRPVAAAVPAGVLGLAGDEQADRAGHGGPDQALYAYAREDLDWWAARLGRPVRDGMFGENVTTAGLDLNGALIGEIWQFGSVVVQVTAPRIPCIVFRNWMGEKGWIRKGGTPRGKCPGASAAGALDSATHGRWTGKYYSSVGGIFITSIMGVKPKGNHFWELVVNGKPSSKGACGVKLARGQRLLFKIAK